MNFGIFGRRAAAIRAEHGIALALFAVTLALFWPATKHQFVDFDDYTYVVENPMVMDGLTARGVQQAFSTVHEQWWLPLLWISYMADIAMFGPGPFGHHLANILLHAANAALLFWALFRLTGSRWRSFFVAALFAWHPTRVEAVAWIAARKDVLSGLFFMLALGAYARHAERPGARRMLPVCALMLAGLMAKAILIVLPPILLLLDFWPLRRVGRPWGPGAWKAWKPVLLEKAPLIALATVFVGVNLCTHSTARGEGAGEPLWARFAALAPNVTDYLRLCVCPVRLSAYYPEAATVAWFPALAALLFVAAATATVAGQGRRRPYWTVGWLWFLLALLPILRGLRLGLAQYADRWTYLPLIGLALALSWTAAEWAERPRGRAWVAAACGAVLVLCMVRTHAQLPWWRNSLLLFGRAVHLAPEAHFARNSLALALVEAGRTEEGVAQFEIAIRQRPAHGDYYSNMGAAVLKAGRAEEALALHDEALRYEKGKAFIHNSRGRALAALGRRDEARAAYEEALRLEPEHPEANYNLAVMLYEAGSAAAALPHFQMAVRGRPGSAPMWFNLGMAQAQLGRYAEAAACVGKALELDPETAGAREAMARLRLLTF